MLPLITLPLRAEVEISSCDALNWLGTVVNALVIDPSAPATLYAGSNGGGVFHYEVCERCPPVLPFR